MKKSLLLLGSAFVLTFSANYSYAQDTSKTEAPKNSIAQALSKDSGELAQAAVDKAKEAEKPAAEAVKTEPEKAEEVVKTAESEATKEKEAAKPVENTETTATEAAKTKQTDDASGEQQNTEGQTAEGEVVDPTAIPATPEEPEAPIDLTTLDMENTLVMDLKDGPVIIKLRPDLAPVHVSRIKELTRQGFYNGVVFHRVIDGFMAQTGDPTGTGKGGSGQNLNSEFSSEKHVRGTVSMARAADPNSADSQFFIMFSDASHLDNNYTIFGQVVKGMDVVDKIKRGTGPNGMVTDPDKITTFRVAVDIPAEELPEALKGAIPGGETAPTTTAPADGAAAPAATEGTAPASATGTTPAAPAATTTAPATTPAGTPAAAPAGDAKTVPASMKGKAPTEVAPATTPAAAPTSVTP